METRTALVTGAAQGPGQEFAVALARRGYRVAGLDPLPQPATAARILDYVELVGDITDESVVEARLACLIGHFGTLHVVVHATGIQPARPFEKTTPEEWRRTLRVNLEAPFVVTRAALPYLKAAGWGRIVTLAPAAAPPGAVPYVTSQAGLIGFTHALAAELEPYAVTVNAIVPGTGQPPGELVSTLLYVLDEGSAAVTGRTLDLSGGGPPL
ncbi:SDR family NAD(P)-dependent oxidoreductase [Streptomyces sp. SID8379]|uniref:SDR family NAD(P)-dependent oxidoreductase n=1 Tax=unclassified Streptomyces TaxID=2593676 RepID=UPI00037BF492|nr:MULTISPECIES: SDR family NAD(P)-dependent oxidoreductase [unclassified Streptomyces]MYW62808.1 SDR family NAD(P)-dependent oxidoreductase [Streptomyces sp. SID8379]